MDHKVSQVPEPISSAITELWRISIRTEDDSFNSGAFRVLECCCRSVYFEFKGSRLPKQTINAVNAKELKRALQNFFRWNGAPWYERGCPSADETALKLHQAFLSKVVKRIHFAPLDRFYLEHQSLHEHQKKTNIRFGQNEVLLLAGDELAQRIPSEALIRFGRWHQFPIEKLGNFYWLITSEHEEAGPAWQRTWLSLFHKKSDEIGRVPLFESTYPTAIENALFVLLLSFVKKPNEAPWKPFAVPWTYSLTDDPFADASRAPDPSVLTRTIVGYPGEEFEAPDRSESFKITDQQLEAIKKRWCKLRAMRAEPEFDQGNFHPLTKYFFVKALAEDGIDEIIANISSIEATLQLQREKSRKNLMKRYSHLVGDDEALKWLDKAYEFRNKYLHSLAKPKETITWEDLAQMRWSFTRVVDAYLDFASLRSKLDRNKLLQLLEQPIPVP